MFKKILATALTMLLLVASVAFAANMQVTSSAVPVSGGTITPNGIKFSATDITYTVAPKAGWSLTSVMIDGVAAAGGQIVVAGSQYKVAFDTSRIHTIKANFAQTLSTFSLTATAGTGGTAIITGGGATGIKATDSRKVVVGPNTGYQIASVLVDGSAVTAAAGSPTAYTVDFTPFGSSNHTVAATFSVIPIPTVVNAGDDQSIAALTTNLAGSVSKVTPVAWTCNPTSGTFGNANAAVTTFSAPVGTYTVTLTADGVSDSATITLGAVSSTCIGCHAGSVPVTKPLSPVHADNSCETCHLGTHAAAAQCGPCHSVNADAYASKHGTSITDFTCRSCHKGDVKYGYSSTPDYANGVFARTSTATVSDHRPETWPYNTSAVCATCHAALRTEFRGTKHWNNNLEYGPEFAGGAIEGQMNANEGWTTTENGKLATCALNCHFKPNLGPDPKAKNARATLSPGKDECLACHDPHKLTATYLTCHDCHRQTSATRAANTGHGLIPAEFYGSKHWKNNLEYGPEFTNQLNTTYASQLQVADAKVISDGTTTDGILNANDSYQTAENGGVVTCAYRCHFRPGMGPQANVGTVLANGKSTGYITYTDSTGKYGPTGTVYSRPGGDSCMACHDAHGLEASAQSTCYTCHAGGNHGWSVAAFEKSSHFTGTYAKLDGMDKEACLACHNAHSTEAEFANLSTAVTLHTASLATGCQKCHTPGSSYSIFNADGSGKTPHFQTNAPGTDGYYPTGSYDGGGSTCIDCHYHNNTINAGWAKGGHASTTSVPLVTSAGDNWNRGTKRGAISNGRTYTGDYTINAQVSDCQRCHTAKGFTLFYDSAFKNVSTVREGITTSGPITCDACHVPKTAGTKLYNGKVRPLASGVTNVKTYVGNAKNLTLASDAVTTSMDFPASYANSNVCIPCHAGRGTGALVKASFNAGTVIGDDTTTVNNARDILWLGTQVYAHFASAAGVVNGTSAYEFNPPAVPSTHIKIGTGAGFGTSSATMGPCVGCHMTSTEGHSLESVTYDVDGKIASFATTTCTNCHGVTALALTPADVQTTKENFEAALNVLRNLLLNRGFDYLQAEIDARPGERGKMNMALGYTAYAAGGGTLPIKDFAERNSGAAFNWWLFGKSFKDGKTIGLGDPAAYVHNPTYTRQVIKDSIDWMDDFAMNNSTAAAIDAQIDAPVKTYSGVADGVPVDAAAAAKAKAFLGL